MKMRMIATPTIRRVMDEHYRDGEKAVTSTMRSVAGELKRDWRQQVVGAGLGRKLGNAVRSAAYPRSTNSMGAASMVWTKAPKITAAHEAGAVIRSRTGSFLAIPTEAAGKGRGGARLTPEDWERRRGVKLRFVYRRGRPSLLVAESRLNARGTAVRSRSKTGRNVATVPIFVLVPQVRLRKRLNLYKGAGRIAGTVPRRIVSAWRE